MSWQQRFNRKDGEIPEGNAAEHFQQLQKLEMVHQWVEIQPIQFLNTEENNTNRKTRC